MQPNTTAENLMFSQIPSELYNKVDSLRDYVKKKLVEELGFSDERAEKFIYAVGEMAENGIKCGGISNINEIYRSNDFYNLVIENKKTFDPRCIPLPFQTNGKSPSMKNHGRGIYLARVLTDKLSYSVAKIYGEEKIENTEVYLFLSKNGIDLPRESLEELVVICWP